MSSPSPVVGGHVNMMTDVLIAQLPPSLLRAAFRHLLSTSPSLAPELHAFVRQSLVGHSTHFPSSETLFPSRDAVTTELTTCLLEFRLLFLSGLHTRAVEIIAHLIKCLSTVVDASGEFRMSTISDPLLTALAQAEGDVIQCMQSIKEHALSYAEDTSDGVKLASLLWVLVDLHSYGPTYYQFSRAYYQTSDTYKSLFPSLQAPQIYIRTSVREFHPATTSWTTPGSEPIPNCSFGPIAISQLVVGLWQLSSPSWGAAGSDAMNTAWMKLMTAGFRSVDMADHYGDAEIIFQDFKSKLPKDVQNETTACTKWCVFGSTEGKVTRDWVRERIMERKQRCSKPWPLDMLQFHWQNYSDKSYLPILEYLVLISREEPELVRAIGLVNFDAEHTDEICQYLKQRLGLVGVVSNQVQYSLIDQRPRAFLADVCKKHEIKLLTYGTFCGGFLSDKWLGRAPPALYDESVTPSQRKYMDMILRWGSWDLFQALLSTLREIADGHGADVDIANVATKWVLEKEEVGSVIVGTRLGVSSNINSNLRVFSFMLSEDDYRAIDKVIEKSNARRMILDMGDCGAEYRHAGH